MRVSYLIYIFIAILLTATSCDEDECCVTPPEVTLLGDWQLDKLCFSNGASTCNEDDLWDPDYSESVTFTADTYSFDRDGEICAGSYELTGLGFDMTADPNSSCVFEDSQYIIIELTKDKLTMSPQCIEGCPHVYVRK